LQDETRFVNNFVEKSKCVEENIDEEPPDSPILDLNYSFSDGVTENREENPKVLSTSVEEMKLSTPSIAVEAIEKQIFSQEAENQKNVDNQKLAKTDSSNNKVEPTNETEMRTEVLDFADTLEEFDESVIALKRKRKNRDYTGKTHDGKSSKRKKAQTKEPQKVTAPDGQEYLIGEDIFHIEKIFKKRKTKKVIG
jgi:hypothetical protein